MISSLIMVFLFVFQVGENDTVQKLQEKFRTVEFLQSGFVQSSGSGRSLVGKFYFKKENNYRIELPNNIIISDGQSIWNEDIKRKKVIVSNIEEDPLAFSLSEYINDYPQKCKVSETKIEEGSILVLDGQDTDLNFKTAKLWINNNYLIDEISVVDFSGNTFSIKFNNLVANKSVRELFFKYEENIQNKVIDLR